MAAFKRKVEKLKIMKEAGLLTPEEFEEEKRKLITSL
ncbi:MAG: SHOCT domain-containing protein [Oscillospiraceae bacterium]|nr:SHOCT domain-containing protein [Oscillospiraceae bacterium]